MRKIIWAAVALAVLWAGYAVSAFYIEKKDFVAENLDIVSRAYVEYDALITRAAWELNKNYSPLSAQRFDQVHTKAPQYFRTSYFDFLQRYKKSWRRLLLDDQQRRMVDILYAAFLPYQGPKELRHRIDSLAQTINARQINFRAIVDQDTLNFSDVYRVLVYDSLRQRRKKVWRAYYSGGHDLTENFITLMRLRNELAAALGYFDYPSLMFAAYGIDKRQLQKSLSTVEERTRLLLAEYITHRKKVVDTNELKSWDAWYDPSGLTQKLDSYFVKDSIFSWVAATFRDWGFGLQGIEFDLDERPGKGQQAYCFAWLLPDSVKVLVSTFASQYSASTLMHEIGHAVHDRNISREIPPALRVPSPLLAETMAMIAASAVYDSVWLSQFPQIPRALIQAQERRKRFSLISFREDYLNIVFELEAYELVKNPQATAEDLTRLWMELAQKARGYAHEPAAEYALISHYVTNPVYMPNYLLARLTARQIRDYFEQKFGPMVNNPNFAKLMRENFYQYGNYYTLEELLKMTTGKGLEVRQIFSK